MSDSESVVIPLQDVDSTSTVGVDGKAKLVSNPDLSLNGSTEPDLSMENGSQNDGASTQAKPNGNANGDAGQAASQDTGGAGHAKTTEDNKVPSILFINLQIYDSCSSLGLQFRQSRGGQCWIGGRGHDAVTS